MGTGARIKEAAKAKGITLRKLAENSGISYNTLYSITKRDSERVDPETVRRIAAVLNVDPLKLMGLEQIDKAVWGHEVGPEVYGKIEENYQQHHERQALVSKTDAPLQVGETFMDGNLKVTDVEAKENDAFTVSFSANPQGVSVDALKKLLDYLSKNGISVDGLMELIEVASNIQTTHPRRQDAPESPLSSTEVVDTTPPPDATETPSEDE